MTRQFVSCASLTGPEINSFVIYHQQLGRFHSDWHQHALGQLIYAENGCIHLRVDEKKILLPGWYGAWIPAHTNHEIWSDSPQLQMRSLCFPVASATNWASDQLSVFPVSGLLREMIRYTEKWSQGSHDNSQANTFIQAIQDVLPDEIRKAIPVYLPATTHHKLAPIVDYIQAHLAENVSLPVLASHFGLSVRTLTRLFNQQLGTSFSSYCRIARIMRSLELIETGIDNVSDLAALVGYESLSTFSNNFLDLCGSRPLQFIQAKRG